MEALRLRREMLEADACFATNLWCGEAPVYKVPEDKYADLGLIAKAAHGDVKIRTAAVIDPVAQSVLSELRPQGDDSQIMMMRVSGREWSPVSVITGEATNGRT